MQGSPQPSAARAFGIRAAGALRRPHNWVQLAKFCTVGASGYVVNLTVYSVLLYAAGLDYRLAATGSFLTAVTNNYTWNRLWTFRHQRGHYAYQGMRFFVVSVAAYIANLAWLTLFVALGAHKVLAQAVAIVLVTPFNFVGNKLWSFRLRPNREPSAPVEPTREAPPGDRAVAGTVPSGIALPEESPEPGTRR